jgi:hypothetical protein
MLLLLIDGWPIYISLNYAIIIVMEWFSGDVKLATVPYNKYYNPIVTTFNKQ